MGDGQEPTGNQETEHYVEVKVDSIRVTQGASVLYLRVLDGRGCVIPVHIGEAESSSLQKEINKQRQARPLTHDLLKNIVQTLGFRVTQIRITDIIANTYYARIHLARPNPAGGQDLEMRDVDARPSDAINLAVRFGAPMYVNKRIADSAMLTTPDPPVHSSHTSSGESHADIVRSVRDALSGFEDPTMMAALQKELAVREERFEDAAALQAHIHHEMTHNQLLRLVVAMESALSDGRYEEAAHLRDEFRRLQEGGSVRTPQQHL